MAASASPDSLARREREIVHVLFALGREASVEEVRAGLVDPPGYSAVRAMLVRLEHKGFVRHREDGVRYLYAATTPPGRAKRVALQQLVRTFFGGSLGDMVTALVRDDALTAEEVDRLHDELGRVRAKRGRR